MYEIKIPNAGARHGIRDTPEKAQQGGGTSEHDDSMTAVTFHGTGYPYSMHKTFGTAKLWHGHY